MKFKLFFVLLFVSIQCMAQDNKLLIHSHVVKLINAKAYTLKLAELMPESKFDFKPVSDEMSFKEQLIHIGQNLYWLSGTFISEVPDYKANKFSEEGDKTKSQAIEFVSEAYDFAINAINSLDPELMSKEFAFAGKKLHKIQFLNLIQDHQTHHRAQLVVYLRLNQIKPPGYIGW